MGTESYIFPSAQADYLRALKDGRYRPSVRSKTCPASVSLADKMPPVSQQAVRGTCVANAVASLVEYYEDCKTRLSVQYLFEASKEIERNGLERNLSALSEGRPVDPPFEVIFHAQLLQIRLLAEANGADSPAARMLIENFSEGVRARFARKSGTLLLSCFKAVETSGLCRYALWPYANVPTTEAPFTRATGPSYPPGTREDARKHRVLSGLYRLPVPNNVEEIRGLLAGANARRPMPVCVTLRLFEGCCDETFTLPKTEERDGRLLSRTPETGLHGLLIVGYTDDLSFPGGGYFTVRNSWGTNWGRNGYGRVPYAYLECFVSEAGTILQDLVDYTGDGYDGLRPVSSVSSSQKRSWFWFLVNLLFAFAIAVVTIVVGVVFDDPFGFNKKRPHEQDPIVTAPVRSVPPPVQTNTPAPGVAISPKPITPMPHNGLFRRAKDAKPLILFDLRALQGNLAALAILEDVCGKTFGEGETAKVRMSFAKLEWILASPDLVRAGLTAVVSPDRKRVTFSIMKKKESAEKPNPL